MSDYIERQKAIDALKAQADTMRTWASRYDEQRRGILTAVNIVEDVEPADVAPVVRCDDCKYYGSRRWCELHSSVFDDNAFCSYGERKERAGWHLTSS